MADPYLYWLDDPDIPIGAELQHCVTVGRFHISRYVCDTCIVVRDISKKGFPIVDVADLPDTTDAGFRKTATLWLYTWAEGSSWKEDDG